MPYPFPSFDDFVFQESERAIDGLGGGWRDSPAEARSRAQGAISDNVVLLNIGSLQRQFECYLSPARYIELRAKLYTGGVFTDWDWPTPDSRPCRLDGVDYQASVISQDQDPTDGTFRRVLCTVRLTSQ